MSLLTKRLVFLDVETTGFNPDTHEITEIGFLVVQQQPNGSFRVGHEVEMKVKPEHIETADPGALRVNGYDAAQWMFAHTLEEAMKELAIKAKGAVMIAHNIAFDYGFINKAFQTTGVDNTMFFQKVDSLSFAIAKLHNNPHVKSYSLRALCEHFGIYNEKAHTALADARATFEMFVELMKVK